VAYDALETMITGVASAIVANADCTQLFVALQSQSEQSMPPSAAGDDVAGVLVLQVDVDLLMFNDTSRNTVPPRVLRFDMPTSSMPPPMTPIAYSNDTITCDCAPVRELCVHTNASRSALALTTDGQLLLVRLLVFVCALDRLGTGDAWQCARRRRRRHAYSHRRHRTC
jgi:hypothetical protein